MPYQKFRFRSNQKFGHFLTSSFVASTAGKRHQWRLKNRELILKSLDHAVWQFDSSKSKHAQLTWWQVKEWPPFGHESIEHESLTALEQWKASRHRSLWLVVSNWTVSKRAPPQVKDPECKQ